MDAQANDLTVIEGEARNAPAIVAASPLDLPAEVFRAGLDRRRENRAALMDWIRGALVDGVDYGRIQTKRGPSKPSLWKPGAEKICGMLGVTVHYPTLPEYERAALDGIELHHIIIRCELRDAGGRVVAEGIGARSLSQDYGDINKALKMAEKSAHIDATLRMAGLSEIFTQDLEDMQAHAQGGIQPDAGAHDAPSTECGPDSTGKNGATQISEAQRKRLEARISESGLDRERIKAWVRTATGGRVKHFRDLSPHQYQKLDQHITAWAQEVTA